MKHIKVLHLYLSSIAILLLGAFLPVEREMLVMRLQDNTGKILKTTAVPIGSFMSGTIPISMLFSFTGLLLLAPTIFAVYLAVRLWRSRFTSKPEDWKHLWSEITLALKDASWFDSKPENWRHLLTISGISLACLLIWWGVWSKFLFLPGIGFWVYIIGLAALTATGVILRQSSPAEQNNPVTLYLY